MLSKVEVRILKFESNINYVVISLAFSAGDYLQNTPTNCEGIPYIFGGCDQIKTGVMFTENETMLLQETVSNTGAVFLVFRTGYSYNALYFFERKTENF